MPLHKTNWPPMQARNSSLHGSRSSLSLFNLRRSPGLQLKVYLKVPVLQGPFREMENPSQFSWDVSASTEEAEDMLTPPMSDREDISDTNAAFQTKSA